MLATDDQKLIERGIVPDPARRRVADARLRESGVPVWAIIGHLRVVGGDAARVLEDYEITQDELDAALAYYRRHRAAIDARLKLNAA